MASRGLVPCLLAALAAAPASAAWVKVYENEAAFFYVDPATIRKNGNHLRAWGMQDLRKKDADGVMSRRGLAEYDCKEARVRLLLNSAFAGPMATGKTLVSNNSPGEWHDIPADSTPGKLITNRRVCSSLTWL